VDGVAYKRALARVGNSGLWAIGGSIVDTVIGLFKTVVGPAIFETDEKSSLLFEQVLLNLNAKLEFQGNLLLLRSQSASSLPAERPRIECKSKAAPQNLLLYDAVKSDLHRAESKRCASLPFRSGYPEEYRKAIRNLANQCPTIEPNSTDADGMFPSSYTLLRFSLACEAITQSP
jgi:hypothetical protein